jgi:hypothetical protein
MNKQELIGKIKEMLVFATTISKISLVSQHEVIELIKQLDEPQKVVVPQFVADFYEDIVDEFYIVLERLILNYENNTDMPICKWFFETEDALTILINMHQFGYEVEKEKRYLVKMKGVSGYGRYLNKVLSSEEYFFASENEVNGYRTKHTKKELEQAGFGWVFDCPGIEVKEVEE